MDDKKRYQIFISSTFADLEEERRKVMETILNFDCFPAGMEMFPAMDEEQFEYIKRVIDDSDYYLLIIGGRYGSVDTNGVSWTEKEFDYAVSKGIPVIAFDHDDFTRLPVYRTDQDDQKKKKLVAFKKKVSTGRLIKKWSNKDDLALAIATSLKSVFQLKPRIGWVRAGSEISADAQSEIEKLKKVIEKEQEKIKSLEAELEKHHNARPTTEKTLQSTTETFTVEGVSFKMIHVEGGTFMMGANEGDELAYPSEKPAHKVTLSDYWMGETQVTQALWQAVMGENPSKFKGDPNLPVDRVSWVDCREFIRKLNKLTGKKFYLPTEVQWEFAARGGNLGKDHHSLYAGSHDLFDVAWYEENSKETTHPVGDRDPNELGLYDMTGNVWEWCNDRFDKDYYTNSPSVDPTGPATGAKRICRGGCWGNSAKDCRVSNRGISNPTSVFDGIGLRLALQPLP